MEVSGEYKFLQWAYVQTQHLQPVSLQSNLLHVYVTCWHILIASIQPWVLWTSATVLTLQWLRILRQSNRMKRIPLFCFSNTYSIAEAAANLKSHSAFKINQYKLNSTTQELTLIQMVKNSCFYRTRWFSTAFMLSRFAFLHSFTHDSAKKHFHVSLTPYYFEATIFLISLIQATCSACLTLTYFITLTVFGEQCSCWNKQYLPFYH